jgi:hypothetical protein
MFLGSAFSFISRDSDQIGEIITGLPAACQIAILSASIRTAKNSTPPVDFFRNSRIG